MREASDEDIPDRHCPPILPGATLPVLRWFRGRDRPYGRPPAQIPQRALLTHWAPTSGHDAQSLFGIRVQCSMLDDFHQPSVVDGFEESTDVRVEYPVLNRPGFSGDCFS